MPFVRKRICDALTAIQVAILILVSPMIAEAVQPIRDAKTDAALSTFGKAVEMTMAVKDGAFRLGDAIVLASSDGSIRIQKTSFIVAIQPVFRPEQLKALEARLPAFDYITLEDLTSAGLKTGYNDTDLEILVEPSVEQRPRGEITGTIGRGHGPSNVVEPSDLSGFINAHFGVAYERGQLPNSAHFEFPAILLDGATRWSGFVVEGEARINIDGDFARHSTRLIYDMPEEAIRVSAGDILLPPDGFFVTPPLFGMAIERTYGDLQPTRNLRPTGKRSFRIDRPSEVRILINDHEVRRFRLSPGEYDLDDLPLASGTNEVRLLIRDEFGKEETVDFSILFNRTLLNPGVSEWSLAGGTTTDTSAGEPDYQDGAPVIAGSIRTGISEALTGGLSVQTTTDAALAGVSSLSQTALGLIGLDATGSVEEDRDRVGWSLQSELNVDSAMLWEGAGSVQLGAEYQSKGYKSSLDDFATIAANLRLHGSFSQPLPKGFSVALSGYYSTYPSTSDEEYGTSVSLTRVVSNELTIGVSGTYESDRQALLDSSEFGGLSVLARLNYRPSAESVLSVQYDRNTGSTAGSLGSSFEDGAKRVNVGLDLQHLPRTESGVTERVLGADMHMSDSRYEVNASQTRHIQGLGSELYHNRTALNFGTGIAFADGHVGVGRPIRNAFAIVDAHQSLADSTIRVSPFQDSYRGKIDGFGPAVVSEISAYTTTNLPYEIDDAPLGYDFGSGSFALVAPYKAGYHLTVGSDFAVTAMGTLKNSAGEPILLKAGTVFSPAHPEKKIVIFTNGAGRFAAQGLKAGAWTIEMNDDDRTTYDVMVPEEATGFFNLGEIMPKGKDSQ